MMIGTIAERVVGFAPKTPRQPEVGTAPAQGPSERTDRVVVSEQARTLAAQFMAEEGPELQLSPARLRALIEQTAESTVHSE